MTLESETIFTRPNEGAPLCDIPGGPETDETAFSLELCDIGQLAIRAYDA